MARVGSSYEASTMPPRPQSVVASGEYHFICECYFLTSNTLHLGLMKTVHDCMQTLEVSIAIPFLLPMKMCGYTVLNRQRVGTVSPSG